MAKAIPFAREYLKLGCIFFIVYLIAITIIVILLATGTLANSNPVNVIVVVVLVHALPLTSCILSLPHIINLINKVKYVDGVYTDIEQISQP